MAMERLPSRCLSLRYDGGGKDKRSGQSVGHPYTTPIAHAAIDLRAPGIAHLPSAASDEGVMYRNLQSVCKKLCFPRHEAALAGVCDRKPRSTYTVAWLDRAFRRRHPAWRKPCSPSCSACPSVCFLPGVAFTCAQIASFHMIDASNRWDVTHHE